MFENVYMIIDNDVCVVHIIVGTIVFEWSIQERERERKERVLCHMIKIDIRSEISMCPRKILLECIICMNDNIVLSVNKGFLSHKSYVHLLSALYLRTIDSM